MVQTKTEVLSKELKAYQWALPEGIDVPPDELRCRLDLYQDAIVLYLVESGIITTRMVSARDIIMALLSEVSLSSGLLPKDTLWWGQGKHGIEVALWQKPRVWPIALVIKPLEPPKRLKLPMPGLIFVCSPGQSPRVYAVKKRPTKPGNIIYHAPLFNIFSNGSTCSGTHHFPGKIEEIPESFFTSFFSMEAHSGGRSKKHPDSLYSLWKELDGERRYPLKDLVPMGKIEDIMK